METQDKTAEIGVPRSPDFSKSHSSITFPRTSGSHMLRSPSLDDRSSFRHLHSQSHHRHHHNVSHPIHYVRKHTRSHGSGTGASPEKPQATDDENHGFFKLSQFWKAYKDEDVMDSMKEGNVKAFYEKQNELLESYAKYSRAEIEFLCPSEREFVASRKLDVLKKHASIDDVIEGGEKQKLDIEQGTSVDGKDEGGRYGSMELGESIYKSESKAFRAVGLSKKATLVKTAVLVSNFANVLLLCVQFYSFWSSRSLSLLANLIDALLDMISGLVVLYAWRMRSMRDKYNYPVGKSRLEPLSVLGLCILMTAATLLTIEESLQTLVAGEKEDAFQGLSKPVVVLVLAALFTKLSLYLFCRKIDDGSVQGLAMDHFNDVISNTCALSFTAGAILFSPLVDPIGGILISCWIIRNWLNFTITHVDNLLGRVAPPSLHSIVTFIACNHDPQIRYVDTVRCYHVGTNIFCEVDIVLPEELPLKTAHDIGEDLQSRIELIDDVERAFVHLDVEYSHNPDLEHRSC